MKTLATNTALAYLVERVRVLIGPDPRISEKTMFGGRTFLLNGHILIGCKSDGRILLSVGKDHSEEALQRPGATPMMHRDRPMTGFVWVDPDAIEDDDDLADWIGLARRWVEQMPIKPAAPAKKTRARQAAKPASRPRKAAS